MTELKPKISLAEIEALFKQCKAEPSKNKDFLEDFSNPFEYRGVSWDEKPAETVSSNKTIIL